jgi:hypothetical protein
MLIDGVLLDECSSIRGEEEEKTAVLTTIGAGIQKRRGEEGQGVRKPGGVVDVPRFSDEEDVIGRGGRRGRRGR